MSNATGRLHGGTLPSEPLCTVPTCQVGVPTDPCITHEVQSHVLKLWKSVMCSSWNVPPQVTYPMYADEGTCMTIVLHEQSEVTHGEL